LKIPSGKENVYSQIMEGIKLNKGFVPVVLYYEATKEVKTAKCDNWINPDPWFIEELKELLGAENVKLVDEFRQDG
jgi:hypothetical protein